MMFIPVPDPNLYIRIQDQKDSGSRIKKIPDPASKNLSIFNPKNWSKLSEKWSEGEMFRIPILIF